MVKVFSVAWVLGGACVCSAGEKADFAAQFKDPPAACRILKINHGWPDDEAGRKEQVTALQERGFGGCVTSLMFGNGYVTNPTNWAAFRGGMEALRQAGLENWLYDEAGYPSGRAGGLVLRDHPERESPRVVGGQEQGCRRWPGIHPVSAGEALVCTGLSHLRCGRGGTGSRD